MIVARVIKPARPFQSSIFRDEIEKAVKAVALEIQKDFERTVATWKDKPDFEIETKTGAAASGIKITVTPDPEKPYLFVDKGTKVRYATMSKDFEAKTDPNVIQAFPGKGKMLFVNKKRPRPGIKARNFSKIIAKTNKAELAREVKNALARAARRSGYGK